MAEIQDAMMFSVRSTSPNDVVCTYSEEFWVLPNVILVLREKSFSLLLCPPMWYLTYYFEIDCLQTKEGGYEILPEVVHPGRFPG